MGNIARFLAKNGTTMAVGCQPCVSGEHGPCGSNQDPGQFSCWCLALINAPRPRAHLLKFFDADDLKGMITYCLLAVTAKVHGIPDKYRRPPDPERLEVYLASLPPIKSGLAQEMRECCETGTVPHGMVKFVETLGAPPGPLVCQPAAAGEGAPGVEGGEVGPAEDPDPAADGVNQADQEGNPQGGHVGDVPPAGSSGAQAAGTESAGVAQGPLGNVGPVAVHIGVPRVRNRRKGTPAKASTRGSPGRIYRREYLPGKLSPRQCSQRQISSLRKGKGKGGRLRPLEFWQLTCWG
jgi:hypothetical protein